MLNYNLYERKETEDGYDYYVPYDIEKTTICDKSIKEIITILQGLELERITGIEMTMKNLAKYKKLIDKEMNEIIRKSFENASKNFLGEKMTKKELIDVLCNIPKKKDFDKMYDYITNLQQENKQLKEEIEEYKRIEQEDLIAFNNYDSILIELEKWLKEENTYSDYKDITYRETMGYVLDKIQELKEKYKC